MSPLQQFNNILKSPDFLTISHSIPPADTTVNRRGINASITQRFKQYTTEHITHIFIPPAIFQLTKILHRYRFPGVLIVTIKRSLCATYRGQKFRDDDGSVDFVKSSFTINEHPRHSGISRYFGIATVANSADAFFESKSKLQCIQFWR